MTSLLVAVLYRRKGAVDWGVVACFTFLWLLGGTWTVTADESYPAVIEPAAQVGIELEDGYPLQNHPPTRRENMFGRVRDWAYMHE